MNAKNKKSLPPLTKEVIMTLKGQGNGYREISFMYRISVQAIQQRVKREMKDLDHRCSQCLRPLEKGNGE